MIASPTRKSSGIALILCKKKTTHMVSLPSIFIPVWEKACRTARCEADLFQRALCNGWRSCMDRRVHMRFFFSWHHRSYIVVVRGLWPHRGWSIFWPPPAPLSFGDGPYSSSLFRPTDHATCRTDPLAESLRLYLCLSTCWMWKDNLTLFWSKSKLLSL